MQVCRLCSIADADVSLMVLAEQGEGQGGRRGGEGGYLAAAHKARLNKKGGVALVDKSSCNTLSSNCCTCTDRKPPIQLQLLAAVPVWQGHASYSMRSMRNAPVDKQAISGCIAGHRL